MASYSFEHLAKFRFWVQKVLPLTYDDSLSYLETLAKVTEYLNVTIDEINKMGDAVEYLNDLGEGWDARLKAMETQLEAMTHVIEEQNTNIAAKFSELDDKIAAQDAALQLMSEELKIEIKTEIDDAITELTRIINEQLAIFQQMMDVNNATLKKWVEDTLEEFKESIPSFEDIIVVDPTTGELTDLQTALNHIYAGGKVSFGGLSCFEWIEVGLSWDEIDNIMVYSLPQGMTCNQINREARKHVYEVFKKSHAIHDILSGMWNTIKSQITTLAGITANAGTLTFTEFDSMDVDVDTLVSYNKTCYDYAWDSNAFIGG